MRVPNAAVRRAHAADPDLTETMPTHTFMELALDEAYAAADAGEVPIGCVIVCDGDLIAQAGNRTLAERDPTAHAEMVAIRRAAEALGSERLVDCDLYVTLEPCTMCAAAISFARIRRLYYGAADPKGGAVESGVRYLLGRHLLAPAGGLRRHRRDRGCGAAAPVFCRAPLNAGLHSLGGPNPIRMCGYPSRRGSARAAKQGDVARVPQ